MLPITPQFYATWDAQRKLTGRNRGCKKAIWQLSRIVCVVRATSLHFVSYRRRGTRAMAFLCDSKSIMREQTYRSRLLLASRWCTAICIMSCRFLLARMVFERHKRRKRKMSPLTLSAILAWNLEQSLGMKLSLALAIKFGIIKCDV